MTTKNNEKQTIQTLLPLLLIAIGVLLMIFKIVVDSEPGAIPLLLILAGAVWYGFKRWAFQSGNEAK